MRITRRLAWALPGVMAAGLVAVVQAPGAAGARPADRWGVIGRNSSGSPVAELRMGPYGRTFLEYPALQPPPYGQGSLGLTVDGGEKVAYGNETDFAGTRLRRIRSVKYWIFTGVDYGIGTVLPSFSMEVDPGLPGLSYTTLVYLPDKSVSPSRPPTQLRHAWQKYDATAPGNRWGSSRPLPGVTGCTLASPCSFKDIKEKMPDAVVSLSVAIQKGTDDAFRGAVDGLQINDVLFDFERSGVRKRVR
ncbi:hypothetical protein [Actinocorallia populi]|uniref:hypothetical protein n=1 Tax=Actinocorallia populi TaxID=2079200 RepID=UPI001300AE8B|nr:hypothetical protein [Actinocorallia populi]